MTGFQSMFGFESILGQEKPIRLLTTLLRNETIPHALLFLGIEGVGKKTTAMATAMASNCMGHGDGNLSKEIKNRDSKLSPSYRYKFIMSGAWYGNDTIWRTIIDLNKINHYKQSLL